MKFIKLLGLAAVAATALMAVVVTGTASATTLTCTNPPGTKVVCPKPLIIQGIKSEGRWVAHLAIGNVECEEYSAEANITETGSSTTTISGSMTATSFSKCNATVTVLSNGSIEIHSAGETNGTVTSTGTEITVEFAGFHCILKTKSTTIGTFTSTPSTRRGKATFDTGGTVPRSGGRSGAFCGSTAELTEQDEIGNPAWLEVDP